MIEELRLCRDLLCPILRKVFGDHIKCQTPKVLYLKLVRALRLLTMIFRTPSVISLCYRSASPLPLPGNIIISFHHHQTSLHISSRRYALQRTRRAIVKQPYLDQRAISTLITTQYPRWSYSMHSGIDHQTQTPGTNKYRGMQKQIRSKWVYSRASNPQNQKSSL